MRPFLADLRRIPVELRATKYLRVDAVKLGEHEDRVEQLAFGLIPRPLDCQQERLDGLIVFPQGGKLALFVGHGERRRVHHDHDRIACERAAQSYVGDGPPAAPSRARMSTRLDSSYER